MRTCLSSLDESGAFGQMMAAEAHRKGFYQAPRASLCGRRHEMQLDDLDQKHFPKFVPIVDFIHVLSYLYRAAIAIGEAEEFGWGLCLEWATACWQGRVDEVLSELQRVARPSTDRRRGTGRRRPADRSWAARVTYLTNNR